MLEFNSAPYYDDFSANNGAEVNNYMRILFKPGNAVQARELTQTQSILQNQIGSFANNIFQNGSPISGGHLTFNNKVTSIQLYSVNPSTVGSLTAGAANVSINLSDFSDQLVINYPNPITTRAKVVAIDDSIAGANCAGAILVTYLTGNEFSGGTQLQATTAAGLDIATIIADSDATSLGAGIKAINMGSIISINQGTFYVDGLFVNVAPQTIVLDSINTAPSFSVGLQIQQDIVTYATDSSLLDPAQGSFNYQAPGADRFQFNLVLTKRPLDSTDTSEFFELLRIENGVITSQVNYPEYNYTASQLAQAVYDQSGDFTVNPFIVTTADNPADSNTFLLNIDPGKAYIKGHEFETTGRVSVVDSKARSQNVSNNYSFNTDYGNYFIVKNVKSGSSGFFNVSNYAFADLHCVESSVINTLDAGGGSYANTLIGTAQVRNIEYSSDGNYYAYVVNANLKPIIANANSTAPSVNTSYIALPQYFSTNANAYVNTTISILSGNCSGDIRTVTYHDTVNQYLYVNVPFSELPDGSAVGAAQTQFSLNFSVSDVNSLVETPVSFGSNVFATQPLPTPTYPCMDISPAGKNLTTGSTVLYLTSQNTLLFKLPNSYLVPDVFTGISYYEKIYSPNIVGTNSFTISPPNSFQSIFYGTSYPGPIDPVLANQYIFAIINDIEESGAPFANGDTIVFDTLNTDGSGNCAYSSAPNEITIILNTGSGAISAVNASVLYTVSDNLGGTGTQTVNSKTLVGNPKVTSIAIGDGPAVGTLTVAGVPSVSVNTTTGCVWFTDYNLVNVGPGNPINLYIPDVVSIVKVFDSGNPNFAPNTTNAIDITSSFALDSGQRENYYDFASIYLKNGYPAPRGQLAVYLSYYHLSPGQYGSSGLFDANSYYSATDSSWYDNIPTYISSKLGSFNLRDCIDFRPWRTIGYDPSYNSVLPANTTIEFSISGGSSTIMTTQSLSGITPGMVVFGADIPSSTTIKSIDFGSGTVELSQAVTGTGLVPLNVQQRGAQVFTLSPYTTLPPLESMRLSYAYYVPRIDKLVLTSDKQFKIINGIPGLIPKVPPNSDDSMSLYSMYVPAYTSSASAVILNYINNRRYTMKDIGGLDKRITNLEAYVSLTQLQQSILNQKVTYLDGSTIKPIYGFISDSFSDYSVADTLNPDFYAMISSNTLTCLKVTTPIDFKLNPTSSGPYNEGEKTISLAYTEEACISQNTATETVPIQPYGFGEFIGNITLTPQTDYFYSTNLPPQIAVGVPPPLPTSNSAIIILPESNVPNVNSTSTVTNSSKPKPKTVGGVDVVNLGGYVSGGSFFIGGGSYSTGEGTTSDSGVCVPDSAGSNTSMQLPSETNTSTTIDGLGLSVSDANGGSDTNGGLDGLGLSVTDINNTSDTIGGGAQSMQNEESNWYVSPF